MILKWFNEVFLQSLFDQCGVDNTKWLTAKQAAVCCQHMELHTAMIEDRWLGQCSHNNYEYEWRGRKVTLSYSKKNGCGTIIFSPTESEAKAEYEKFQRQKHQAKIETIRNRLKKRPESYYKKIAALKEEIAYFEEILQEPGAGYTEDNAAYIKRLKAELKLWESVK